MNTQLPSSKISYIEQETNNNYTFLKNFKGHQLFLNEATNSTTIVKQYPLSAHQLLLHLQKINMNCGVNIVQIEKIIVGANEIYSFETFITGFSLNEVLATYQFSSVEVANLMEHLVSILITLKQNNIIHRDIKPDNIIIGNFSLNKLRIHSIYLIDFDISRFYTNNQSKDTQLFGTDGFAAPEQFGYGQTSCASDIYSLGKTLELIIQHNPHLTSPLFTDLIAQMTAFDPNHRITHHQILKFLEPFCTSNSKFTSHNPMTTPYLGKLTNPFIPVFYWQTTRVKLVWANVFIIFSIALWSYAAVASSFDYTGLPFASHLRFYFLFFILFYYLMFTLLKAIHNSTKYSKLYQYIFRQLNKESSSIFVILIKYVVYLFICDFYFAVTLILSMISGMILLAIGSAIISLIS